ncbi:slipin family protein [Patescibacteria group bacterium]|nr:slipin family protein [Patescibacteria group bacterium]
MEVLIALFGAFLPLAIIVFFIVISAIKQVNEYEKGVKFSFGKYSGLMGSGWRIVLPIFQTWKKVDMRTRVVDVPEQETLTKDNIAVKISAVIYYKVVSAEKAILAVEDYNYAIYQLAQTTMRNIVGEVEMDELLSKRDEISARIKEIVDKTTDGWGVEVENVALKDVILPDNMVRTIAKQAESEREKRATIIKADGERQAADNLVEAAKKLSSAPGALHLRTLSTLNDLSSDQSNTVIFALPLEVLRAFETYNDKGKK